MLNFSKKGNSKNIKSELLIYHRLFDLGKKLLAEPNIQQLLKIAMDSVIEISGAERGIIVLFNEKGNTPFQTARNIEKQDIDHPEFEINRTIMNKVRSDEESICLRNALDDPTLRDSDSIAQLKILSVICLPLKHKDDIFGVIYLDNRTVKGVFKSEIYGFIKEFANFISLAAYRALECKQLYNQVSILEEELRTKFEFESIVGHHSKMLEVLKLVSRVADTDATILIQGESGTGKELVAQALHGNSCRKEKPFITIDCGTLAEHLLESELFGHVKGAFTGAIKDEPGWFEHTDGGTIFLDEVNNMSPTLQMKLLRVLQTGEYSRVGSTDICRCDIRFVAASNKDLQTLVLQNKFKEELYYRLNVIDIWLPPLRERKSDLPLLIQYFLEKYCTKFKKTHLRLSSEVENRLLNYNYPGNIRELENIIQRAVILAEDKAIELDHLPGNIFKTEYAPSSSFTLRKLKEAKRHAIEITEKNVITDCLEVTSGHISNAATKAGIHVSDFHKKMKKYGIDPSRFKK